MIQKQLEKAFALFRETNQSCPKSLHFEQRMRHPEKKIGVSFAHNGIMYNGFRIQYNTILGPAKGGIRAASYVNEEECIIRQTHSVLCEQSEQYLSQVFGVT